MFGFGSGVGLAYTAPMLAGLNKKVKKEAVYDENFSRMLLKLVVIYASLLLLGALLLSEPIQIEACE